MTPKEKQRQLIIEIMKADEESGLYTTRKQTAVDWLVMKWATQGTLYSADITHALEMEKYNILKTWYDCKWSIIIENPIDAEQYYQETYEK